MHTTPTLTALALLLSLPSAAADSPKKASSSGTFSLGEVTVPVEANMDSAEMANTQIDAEELQQLNLDTVSSALAMLPGISLSAGGARNETMFYVRGNDPRQVPVFVDGVPCYIPYDGNIDYARFSTFDVSTIEVAKGFSSLAFGANTLGGAINIVTRKPVSTFEGNARVGVFEGNGTTTSVNAGSNQGWWYVQGGASYDSADHFRMSSNFTPNAREDGGWRDNSAYTDKKLSMKVGITPNATDEYAFGIVRQRGDKGDPVSTDTTTTPRYWRWPIWNMDSTFLVTRTAVGDRSYVKFRAYFDRYENGIDGYTDATYTTLHYAGDGVKTTQAGPTLSDTGHSRYKDFSHGIMAEFGSSLVPRNSLKFIAQIKTDVHREGGNVAQTDDTVNWPHFEDHYLILGIEDGIALTNTLDLSVGAGWDQQKPEVKAVWSSNNAPLSNTQSLWHGQAGVFWKVAPNTRLYATIAEKDHFATMKDRYSYKMGSYYPNPDLKAETALNYEVGVKSLVATWLEVEAALFRSDIQNLIQSVYVNTVSSTKMYQMQNIGKVVHQGAELGVGFKPSRYVRGGLGYTYLDREDKSSSLPLTGTPRHRGTGYVRVDPIETFYVQASLQSQDRVCDATTPTYVGGFTTLDLKVGWEPTAKLGFDAGFTNINDKNYQYSTGYPMPGRMWFANARYTF